MNQERRNTLTIILFIVYIMLLIGIILFKLPFYSPYISDGTRVINLIPLQGSFDENGSLVLREIIDNILIFIPFGIYICLLKEKWSLGKKVLIIILLTLAFEVTQFVFAMGRSDITDVLDNTLGGMIGIGIYALLRIIFKERTTKVINVFALIVTVIIVLRFGQLFYFSHFSMRRLHS